MTTDTSERVLESLICDWLTGARGGDLSPDAVRERPANYAIGWIAGDSLDYDKEF